MPAFSSTLQRVFTNMPNLMILILVLFHCKQSTSLSCLRCDRRNCKNEPKPVDCRSGELAKDMCGCCDVCAAAVYENCGGLWGMAGHCADYLYCQKEDYGSVGICKPNTCTTRQDCFKGNMMCERMKQTDCLCKNGKCKKNSGCGTKLDCHDNYCWSANCEDEGKCVWLKGKDEGKCVRKVGLPRPNRYPTHLKGSEWCYMNYQPVCGYDGKTYANHCKAGKVALKCVGECPCPVCGPDYNPVCGIDGKTYPNYCAATNSMTYVMCSGECPCPGDKYHQANKIQKSILGAEWRPCPKIYRPVCGYDGKSYNNDCVAKRSGVSVMCMGKCPCKIGFGPRMRMG